MEAKLRRDTRRMARGKWDFILATLINKKALKRGHGPCPACGGKDRYRYDDKNGNGDFYCSQCGSGDGFDLLCRAHKWDFKTAAGKVDELLGGIPADKQNLLDEQASRRGPFGPQIDVEKRRRALNKVWSEAKTNIVMTEYLASRGIDVAAAERLGLLYDMRGSSHLFDADTGNRVPGMVAMVRNGENRPIGLHRTLLPPQGPRQKKLMPPIEKIEGAAIRLGAIREQVVIGEGIETTLAGCLLFNMPGMVGIFANNMERLIVPGTARDIVVLSDNDRTFTGQAAAFALARKLAHRSDSPRVRVVLPENAGDDMADYGLRGGTLVEFDSKAGQP